MPHPLTSPSGSEQLSALTPRGGLLRECLFGEHRALVLDVLVLVGVAFLPWAAPQGLFRTMFPTLTQTRADDSHPTNNNNNNNNNPT